MSIAQMCFEVSSFKTRSVLFLHYEVYVFRSYPKPPCGTTVEREDGLQSSFYGEP